MGILMAIALFIGIDEIALVKIYWKPYVVEVLVYFTLIQARQYLDAFALRLITIKIV